MPSLTIEELVLWKRGKVYIYMQERTYSYKGKWWKNKDNLHCSGQHRSAAHFICQ